jgi:hypothetical protein
MNRKFSIALAIFAVAVLGVAATDANAQCNPIKPFTTAFGAGGNSFVTFPADADVTLANIKGRFWASGARSAGNEGTTCPNQAWIFVNTDPDLGPVNGIAVFGNLGGTALDPDTPCVASACIAGNMTLLLQTKSLDGSKSYFAIAKVAELDGGFDFGSLTPNANWTVAESPRARVTSSGRTGGNVNVNIHFDSPTLYAKSATPSDQSGPTGLISGYQVFRVNSNTDPGRAPAAWGAPIQTVNTTASGADINGLIVDCSAVTTDVFFGTRAVYEGGQFVADEVSQATRIECDPSIAEPRFKQIDKKRPTVAPRTPGGRQ